MGRGLADGFEPRYPLPNGRSRYAFDYLLGTHLPTRTAQETLVLAAATSLCGLTVNGAPMPKREQQPVRLADIAREANLCSKQVKRATEALKASGYLVPDGKGLMVVRERIVECAGEFHRCVRYSAHLRSAPLIKANTRLLAALVAGQTNARYGVFRRGRQSLADLLGFGLRGVDHALAAVERAGLVKRWSHYGRLHLMTVKSGVDQGQPVNATKETFATGQPVKHEVPTGDLVGVNQPSEGGQPVNAVPRSTSSTESPCVRAAQPLTRTRGQSTHPGAGDPIPGKHLEDRMASIESFVCAFRDRGIEHFDLERHGPDLAGLLYEIGPLPAGLSEQSQPGGAKRRAALFHDRLDVARKIALWARTPERLGRWLCAVLRTSRIKNLGAYLRVAARRGDPGTVIGGGSGDRLGRFSTATERSLEGKRLHEVAEIIGTTALAATTLDMKVRQAHRDDMKRYLKQQRNKAAQQVLLRLVPKDPSDEQLRQAVAGVCSLREARQLLAA